MGSVMAADRTFATGGARIFGARGPGEILTALALLDASYSTELVSMLTLPRATVSRVLAELSDENVIASKRIDGRMIYRLNRRFPGMSDLIRFLKRYSKRNHVAAMVDAYRMSPRGEAQMPLVRRSTGTR